MKSIKLLACLVTLQFTSGLTLEAADSQTFREWTDAKGRQITARLVEASETGSVKIERKDGQIFTVAVTVFSQADQAYVDTVRASQKAESGSAVAQVTANQPSNGGKLDNSPAGALSSGEPKSKFTASSGSSSSRSGTGAGIGGSSAEISFFGVPLATP